ncbi:hypothetical protein ACU610_02815 [Geodermatophilus sp. URMC 61]|uniref:hypothetical protein n=1 Tax=Geodermatophilus sp. URMC 61 TaxID=3423411 RepID=UPI00406C61CE
MNMAAYAVYDAETGEVVHMHVEPAELGSSPEEIASIVDVQNPQRLRAIRLPAQDLPSGAARVVDGELRAEEGANWGQAAVEGPEVEPDLTRRYRPQPPTDAFA